MRESVPLLPFGSEEPRDRCPVRGGEPAGIVLADEGRSFSPDGTHTCDEREEGAKLPLSLASVCEHHNAERYEVRIHLGEEGLRVGRTGASRDDDLPRCG